MMYLPFDDYKKLYIKYLEYNRSPQDLIELAGDLSGKVAIDLCCGDGRLGNQLQGVHKVYYVDGCKEMMVNVPDFGNAMKKVIDLSSDGLCMYIPSESTDVVFCQQAINYILSDTLAKDLAQVLKKGGLFIFNTFNNKPPNNPQINSYHCDGFDYTEVNWSGENDIVYHVQIREGLAPHSHSFFYFSPDRIAEILHPYFIITRIDKGKSSIYKCQRK